MVLEKGRIVAEGAPHEVLDAPKQESVAQLVGIENVFDATVTSVHEDLGTMSCALAGTNLELEVPLGRYDREAWVRIGICAGDILMATAAPEHLSARNVIRGTIVSLRQEGVTVHAQVDCGISFRVKLTPGSVRTLQLAEDKPVWLVIKTYSCHLLRPSIAEKDE
jgi:molybdate transport system ATP-binding protein